MTAIFRSMPVPVMLLCLSAAVPAVHAQTAEERLYAQARSVAAAAGQLVADSTASHLEMRDGGGASMGTVDLRETISAWSRGEPVRTVTAISHPEHASAAAAVARFKLGLENHPDQAVRDARTVERGEPDVIAGTPCTVLVARGTAGKMRFESKLWIADASGLPLRVVTDYTGLPMTRSFTQTITFGRSQQAAWVPVSAVVEATVGMLVHGRVIGAYQFNSWVPRPGEQ